MVTETQAENFIKETENKFNSIQNHLELFEYLGIKNLNNKLNAFYKIMTSIDVS